VSKRGPGAVNFFQITGEGRDGTPQVRNPPERCVFDRDVTYNYKFDFYCCHQRVTQGSITPTYYDVLYNDFIIKKEGQEGGMQAAKFQEFTQQFASIYQNWPGGPIRVPAPLIYAAKLSDMVADHLREQFNPRLQSFLFFL